jgi:hypothetical protein
VEADACIVLNVRCSRRSSTRRATSSGTRRSTVRAGGLGAARRDRSALRPSTRPGRPGSRRGIVPRQRRSRSGAQPGR